MVQATVTTVGGYGTNLATDLSVITQLEDGVTPNQKVTVAQFHNTDNQSLVSAATNGLLTGGVAQVLNAAGNLDRQRGTGIDQIPCRGVITGAAQFAQEVLTTTTTTVAAAAATATLAIANTSGFAVGGSVNFEPGTARYESATITALVANTSVTVAFATGGALFTHTQPYAVQTFLYNQERDFSGEGPMAQGIGAAIATEFESNSGGPAFASGLASGWTLDADRNFQGKTAVQAAITATTGAATSVTFSANPWVSGLTIGQPLILSVGATGAAVEEVIVSKNNTVTTTPGATVVNLVNPVINANSTYATFDAFGIGGPATNGASVIGVEDNLVYVYDAFAVDPKRPLFPTTKARGTTGAQDVRSGGNLSSLNVTASAVIKASPGRLLRVTVQTAIAVAAVTLNDTTTTGGAAAANAFFTIPSGTAAGSSFYLDWPCLSGIVAAFGTATGALAFSYD